MGRAPCCDKLGLKKGPWTPEEDQKLIAYIQRHGHGSWRALPKNAGLLRCGKSCRLRWTNYLRPDIKRGRFSLEEEQLIIQLHAILGNRWSAISTHLPGRTDNEIKNYWNTHLKKRLLQMGIDPVTHKPKSDLFDSFDATKPLLSSTLSHMAQWENARLEAEARLAREYIKFASCRQHTGSSMQPTDMGAWKAGDVWESIRKDFSSTASMEQSCTTDFRKMLRDWEQSLQGHALNVCDNVIQDRFCTPDFSFLSNGSISLPFDVSHTTLMQENFCDNLGLKGVPKLEQNLSPSSCSLDSMDDQPNVMEIHMDNSLQCESLLQQSEKLLQSKALFHRERSADIIQSPSDKPHEDCLAATEAGSYVSSALSEAAFWPREKLTRTEPVDEGCPPTLGDANELLSQDTNNNISFSNNSSFSTGLQLPAELLLDLASLQQHTKTACAAASDQVDLSSFSDQALSMQSKDYWCNVLKLVGSPVLG
ncbi:hypothetical protein O6H91_06G064600 [Diphasiastrum complanatum]|uniref:Uncharacterized protein n=1 Tax=Diphasiastrum complanatum TaxID=34168 RepID=A0ACC2DET0_DIPCM|nr:hypothetical protein O6H91_06G064600 [Diphasiastrum complanatum]